MAQLDILTVATAVFIGNIGTVALLWCLKHMDKKDEREVPGWAIGGFLLVLLVVAGGFAQQALLRAETQKAVSYQGALAGQP